ncbi:hypothetical protein [Halobacillus sp. H74]|uniref:hypothetical protein n=1 Tax=Halobacillus sp. H74 TaxID=3457436 RepID=UPI003FCDDC16
MAGYIFNLDSEDSLRSIIDTGVYSTKLNVPKNGIWNIPIEGTFADYLSMKNGDNVYFFLNRKVYGIGKLINIGIDCKYLNFPEADFPSGVDYKSIRKHLLLDNGVESVNNRFICTFEPSPYFFSTGIDMDDVLASNPKSFRMLRAFWKLSFLKVDDEENRALKDIILKRNEEYLVNKGGKYTSTVSLHSEISKKINRKYNITSSNILDISSKDTFIKMKWQ